MRRIGLCIAFLFLAWLLTGVTQIHPGERAVVRRFGAVVATPGPGLWVGFPWGVERVDRVPVDMVRRVTVGFSPNSTDTAIVPPGQMLTGDQNLVEIQAVIDYSVEGDQVDQYLNHRERVDGLVARSVEAALSEWIAGQPIDEVLLTAKATLPQWLPNRINARLEPYQIGVTVLAASISHLQPPDRVKPAFDEVTSAQAAIRTREEDARREADRKRREAAAEKFRLEQQAIAYRHEAIAKAEADAAGFAKRMEQYHRLRVSDPDILTAIWWDEMGKVLLRLKDAGRIDLLDSRLGPDGLDIITTPPRPKK